MLHADKRALETDLRVELIALREKELTLFSTNCQTIGTVASIAAGFAFAGLMQPLPDEPEALRLLFLVATVAALGLQLSTVVSTTLLSMLAPGLALRGPEGAMHRAVDGMLDEYRLALLTLIVGILCIYFAAACFVWLVFAPGSAAILFALLVGSVWMLTRYVRKMMHTFAISSAVVNTGKFETREAAQIDPGGQDTGEQRTLSSLIFQEQGSDATVATDLHGQQRGRGAEAPRQERLGMPRARGSA